MKRRGFTLIELLVVIAIIALLAAILFPVFGQARSKARQATCISNLKQIGTALAMYMQDFDEAFPPNSGLAQWGGSAVKYWFLPITSGKYMPGADLTNKRQGILWCQESANINQYLDYRSNYLVNANLTADTPPVRIKMLADLPVPAGTVYLIDAGAQTSGAYAGCYFWNATNNTRVGWVHNNGANVLWLDNHVTWARQGTITDGMFTLKAGD